MVCEWSPRAQARGAAPGAKAEAMGQRHGGCANYSQTPDGPDATLLAQTADAGMPPNSRGAAPILRVERLEIIRAK